MSIFKNKKKVAIFAVVIAIVLFVGNWFYCNNPFNPYYKVKNLRNLPEGTPVYIGDNKLFFAGSYSGYYSENKKDEKITCASIYDIKKQKNVPLNACMNVPRSYYIPILLDSNRILVLGGIGKDSPKCNVSKVAEIYDIKENKFRRIENSKNAHYNNEQLFYLRDKVFIVKNSILPYAFEIFDIKTEIFKTLNNQEETSIALENIQELDNKKFLAVGYGGKDEYLRCIKPEIYKFYYDLQSNKLTKPISVTHSPWLSEIIKAYDGPCGVNIFNWQSFIDKTGKTNTIFCSRLRYDTKLNCFKIHHNAEYVETIGRLNQPRFMAKSINIKNKIYVFGGYSEKWLYIYPIPGILPIKRDLRSIEMYNSTTSSWKVIGRLPIQKNRQNLLKINDSTMLYGKSLIIFK